MKRKILKCFTGILFLLLFPSFTILAQNFEPSGEDLQFLEMVQRKSFDYFLNEHHPETGLVKDKASNFWPDNSTRASIAATGFGLSAMVVGAERGWIPQREAKRYCAKTLGFFLNQMESHHGFFFHFVHWETGKRQHHTELSSIDTALFLAGALTAGEYFKGTEVEELANRIYERVDFPWMTNGHPTLSMGWFPDGGFLKPRWENYNESLILYILAIGSPTHPLPPTSWRRIAKRTGIYGRHVLIYSPSLFTHQYPHIWLDLRNKNDGTADYFENSKTATLVNREFALDQRGRFKTYSENIWGLTASLSPQGYKAYGAEPGGAIHDGTVAPTAAGSSIVFTPELSIPALKAMYENYGKRIWGKYGFSDAFNLDRDWYATEVLAIDQGPLLLMIENYRSELLWKFFMRHPAVKRGMELAGFRKGTLKLKAPPRPAFVVGAAPREIIIDGDLRDWAGFSTSALVPERHLELGDVSGPEDASAEFYGAWDGKFFYLAARVKDESLVSEKQGDKIWQDDVFEIFLDASGNGFAWGSADDFQFGFSPGRPGGKAKSWAWFQEADPSLKGGVRFEIQRRPTGYDLEAAIPWKFLKINPEAGRSFGFSPALHDMDWNGSEGKLNWYFLADGKTKRFRLGEAVLKKKDGS